MDPVQTRIIKLRDLVPRIGCSRATVYARLDPKDPRYDPAMPRPVNLGGRSVGWVESEVEAWLQTRIAMRGVSRAKGELT